MIGIIGNIFEAYPLIEQIRKKYHQVDIIIVENINLLKHNNCNIIISLRRKELDNIIYYDRDMKKGEYSILENNLLEYIRKGKEQEIRNYLKLLVIPKNSMILLNHPLLGYIKDIIQNIFPNEMIDRTEEILIEIEEKRKKDKISFSKNNKIILLKEE